MKNNLLTNNQNIKINNTYFFNTIKFILKNQKQDFINLGFIDDDNYNKLGIVAKKNNSHWNKYFYMINLYLKSFEKIEFSNINSALEIGSGVGGGAYLLKEYFNIKNVVGVDASQLHIIYSKLKFNKNGIIFKNFTSDNFTELKTKFDLIYSIEASSHFQDLDVFFTNVNQSLHKDGIFLYVDLFKSEQIDEIKNSILKYKFNIIMEDDISEGVLNSISYTSKLMKNELRNADGMEVSMNSELYINLNKKKYKYVKFICQI
jgi:2-polyprenyl-3-methyl-5-hydroxy-6-metoxy-1,4-benzoquinol methylase